ncbi:hypothetical protein EG348_13180 [Chryseobacterium sp. G0201]|nr:hypothetical protein EG348_13180 [Chryseobacterium sp. G0201]
MKNHLIVYFRIVLMIFSFSLPFIFTKGAYENMISKGHYLWFIYFILIFLWTIYFLVKTNYYELVNAKITLYSFIFVLYLNLGIMRDFKTITNLKKRWINLHYLAFSILFLRKIKV